MPKKSAYWKRDFSPGIIGNGESHAERIPERRNRIIKIKMIILSRRKRIESRW
ncbi:hypothetical protein SMITH_27 [Smithella sp. ME-1]|uniref:Uncharacterized protein n=1 Tax=hydrocarbon metagenome TaxID=938273 RepID=A0A0W8FMB7_9ZZZZ|nr:hypothetical protein SMITH_27 [Smithella sp. ME-1]